MRTLSKATLNVHPSMYNHGNCIGSRASLVHKQIEAALQWFFGVTHIRRIQCLIAALIGVHSTVGFRQESIRVPVAFRWDKNNRSDTGGKSGVTEAQPGEFH